MSSPRQKVMEVAALVGATVIAESDNSHFTIKVEAPEGTHWNDGEIHEFVSSQFRGYETYAMWKDMLDRMDLGFEHCHSKCEWWTE